MTAKFVILMCALLLIAPISAFAEQINPEELVFNNMLSGGYAEETVIFTVPSEQNIPVTVSAIGPIKDWIHFNQTSFLANAAAPLNLHFTIEPPADALLGSYEGLIVLDMFGGGTAATSVVSTFVTIKIKITIVDKEIVEVEVLSTEIMDAEQGQPIGVTTVIKNKGNVMISPQIEIYFSDLSENILFTHTQEENVMPSLTKKIDMFLPSDDLPPGQYKAKVVVSLNNFLLKQESSLFNIFPPGFIKIAGRLVRIESDIHTQVNTTTVITSSFENTGEIPVSAQLIGDMYVDNQSIQSVSSELIMIAPGEIQPIRIPFTPPRVGRYKFIGHVSYNDKITETQSTVFDVVESFTPEVPLSAFGALPLLLMFLLIIYFVRRYAKNKISKQKRIRRKIRRYG